MTQSGKYLEPLTSQESKSLVRARWTKFSLTNILFSHRVLNIS